MKEQKGTCQGGAQMSLGRMFAAWKGSKMEKETWGWMQIG